MDMSWLDDAIQQQRWQHSWIKDEADMRRIRGRISDVIDIDRSVAPTVAPLGRDERSRH